MKNTLKMEVEGLFVGQLIDVLTERKEGYQRASEKMEDPYLKQLFISHAHFSDLLILELLKYTEEEFLQGIFTGWKLWVGIETSLQTKQRGDLLEACINGEQNSIYFYMEILKYDYIPSELKIVLQRQLNQIKSACDLLKIFKICL